MEATLNIDVVEQLGNPMVRFAIGANAVVLDASEVENLIAWLARCRSGMQPAVGDQPVVGAVMAVENNPNWQIRHDAQADGALLMLRHSGIGWLGFVLSEHKLSLLDTAIRAAETQQCDIERHRMN